MNSSSRILLGLGLGLFGGILYSINDTENLRVVPLLIEPLGELWVNAIRMTVIPLLMALLITAIAGQHSGSVVANLGGNTIVLLVVMIAAASLYTFLLAPPLLALLPIDPAASRSLLEGTELGVAPAAPLPPFRDWLVSLIPANPFAAAANSAILPLMIFSGLFAAALLHVQAQQRAVIVNFFEAIKSAMFIVIGWIMQLAPIGIFALVFPLAATLGTSAIQVLGSFILIASGLIIFMTLLLYPLAVIGGRLPLRAFVRAITPVQIIGFSTRSSLAALPATFTATEALGIPHRISGLVLPVAVTLFKFASPIGRIAGTYFIADLYGIELGVIAMLIVAAAIGLFSFYSPGIPSGGLLIMTPVYVSLGLPVAGIGLLIAVDLIVDMFITASNVTANVTVAILLSRSDRLPV